MMAINDCKIFRNYLKDIANKIVAASWYLHNWFDRFAA